MPLSHHEEIMAGLDALAEVGHAEIFGTEIDLRHDDLPVGHWRPLTIPGFEFGKGFIFSLAGDNDPVEVVELIAGDHLRVKSVRRLNHPHANMDTNSSSLSAVTLVRTRKNSVPLELKATFVAYSDLSDWRNATFEALHMALVTRLGRDPADRWSTFDVSEETLGKVMEHDAGEEAPSVDDLKAALNRAWQQDQKALSEASEETWQTSSKHIQSKKVAPPSAPIPESASFAEHFFLEAQELSEGIVLDVTKSGDRSYWAADHDTTFEEHLTERLLTLMDAAAAFGFWSARLGLEPAFEQHRKMKDGTDKANKGKAQEADDWHGFADIIQAKWLKDQPGISQDGMSTTISDELLRDHKIERTPETVRKYLQWKVREEKKRRANEGKYNAG